MRTRDLHLRALRTQLALLRHPPGAAHPLVVLPARCCALVAEPELFLETHRGPLHGASPRRPSVAGVSAPRVATVRQAPALERSPVLCPTMWCGTSATVVLLQSVFSTAQPAV